MQKITPKKRSKINIKNVLPAIAILIAFIFGLATFISTGDAARFIAFLFK